MYMCTHNIDTYTDMNGDDSGYYPWPAQRDSFSALANARWANDWTACLLRVIWQNIDDLPHMKLYEEGTLNPDL